MYVLRLSTNITGMTNYFEAASGCSLSSAASESASSGGSLASAASESAVTVDTSKNRVWSRRCERTISISHGERAVAKHRN